MTRTSCPDPTVEEIAEWSRRYEEALAHPERLVPFDEVVKRLANTIGFWRDAGLGVEQWVEPK